MHTIFILLLPGIVLAYHILCPDRSHSQLRSHALCTRRDNINYVYTCLEDVYQHTLTFIESCSEVEDFVRPGKRYVIEGQSTIGDCSTDRYQPIAFYKTFGPTCMYVTSTCSDVGQLIATKGSGISDTTCICDYTEGYAYVTTPADVCNCVPSEEDCICYVKSCPENYLLSGDFECIHRNVINVTKCASLDKSENNLTSTTTTTMITDSTAFNESSTRVKNADYAATIMTVIILILSGVIIGVLYFLINRDIHIQYFTKALADKTCTEGENVQFECEVLDDIHTATWFKDGIKVSTSDKYKVERHGKVHRLVVNSTKCDDKGEYSVRINNCTRLCKLIVQEYFTKALNTQRCIEGEDVQFKCEVLDDNQTAYWYKDGTEINASYKYKVENHGKLHMLVVNNATLDERGEYSVRIKNCIRRSNLTVQEYFTEALAAQTCIEGEDVQFECEVIDDSQTALWFINGSEVSNSDKYKLEKHGRLHRLVVNNIKLDDKGEYSVKIKNCVRHSKLMVREYFAKALDTKACTEGEDVQFECEVLDDKHTALWYKDGTEVITSDRYIVESHGRLHRLVVKNTKLADKGEYSVRIKNCTRLCKLIVQELLAAIQQLSEEDKHIYLESIKSGTETRYYIRIVIIGENGVGKTCLLRRLLGESIEDVISTDGIDVVHRCKIRLSDGQWIIDKGTNKRKDLVTRLNKTINAKTYENQQNQPGISKKDSQTKTSKKSVEDKIKGTELSAPSTGDKEKMKVIESSTPSTDDNGKMKVTEPLAPSTGDKGKMKVTEPSTLSTDDNGKIELIKQPIPSMYDNRQDKSDALSSLKSFSESKMTEKKIVTGLKETLTKSMLNELSQIRNDKEKTDKEVLVDLGFWDFAGQKEYYPTHPIFLNPNAVHLLVASITKDIKKINTESSYNQIGEYIDFWFDSIHSCRDVEDTKNFKGEHLNPSVIVVCTHIDKCEDKLDEEKKFLKQLMLLLGNEDKRKHLQCISYISNANPSKDDLDNLRQSIFESGKKIKTFGEKLPLKWIQLEQALDILCEAGENVMSWPDMVNLASEFSIQNEKEVNLFLQYHHKIGNIIYFESLKDHIILNPKWLADAFRCFIADAGKYDKDIKLTGEWQTLEETGELKPRLIVKLFEKDPKRAFYKHKDHLLEVMEIFGILVKLPDKEQNVPTYYMPCMISKTTSINQVYDVFGVLRDTCTRTPWLCIQFDFMPFDFFNHILFQYAKRYSVCTEAVSERKAIYHGIGVFYLEETYSNKFILCFSKNTTAIQIWQWTKLEKGKCKSMLEELVSVIYDVKYKCEPRRVPFTVKIKCADGDIHITAGRKSYKELTDLKSNEYFCEDPLHQQMHNASDSFQTWFENYSEKIITTRDEDAMRTNHTVQEMPTAIQKLSEEVKELHLDIIKSGTETRYHLRICIIGQYGVGKTCLLRRLLKKSIIGVQSTDGIDIHRCRIRLSDGEWIFNTEKVELPADEFVECEILDFAGEREYYATHPVFLIPNAVYLIVANIMKDVKPITAENGFDMIGEYVNFWLDTIHSCGVEKESKMETETEFLNPPTIIVCTRIDECRGHLQERKEDFRKQLHSVLRNETKKNHIRDICYVSSTESDEDDFDVLRDTIFKYGKQVKTFAEKLPLKWIRLEQELDVLRATKFNIISWTDIVESASKCSINSEDEICLFLRYQHRIGGVIYFESVKEYIILNQKWLSKAFRCLVSVRFDSPLTLSVEWKALEETGKLEHSLIVKLFDKEPELDFNKHRGYILNVMEIFGIIVKISTLTENGQRQILPTYYMPCMISWKASLPDIFVMFSAREDYCKRTPWLCIEFDFMPLDFSNHILSYYISQYPMCTEPQTGRMAIYHGMGVFNVDCSTFTRFMLCFCKNTIALQIWQYTDMQKGKYKVMLEELVGTIRRVKEKFETRRVSYTVKLKCADGYIHSSAGRLSYSELLDSGNDYFCEEHSDSHNIQDFFQTWFEDYTEQAT